MLEPNDLWLLEDEASLDQPADVLQTMPELRPLADADPDDDELGLRSILEDPEVLTKAWRRSCFPRSAPRPARRPLRPRERGLLDLMRANT